MGVKHLRVCLNRLLESRDLDEAEAVEAFSALLNPEVPDALVGAFLTALRMKGETEGELIASALAMRQVARKVSCPGLDLLDTCGTGGDGSSSLNISTMASLLCASLGQPVAKHGNRSVSSLCGSADIIEALGLDLESSPEVAQRKLEEVGYAFLFAPNFHPATARVAAVRRHLGVRTIFNLLGPLLNPANAKYQIIGVYDSAWSERMAKAAASLGVQRCLVVQGEGGWDELTPWGNSDLTFWDGHKLTRWSLSPDELDFRKCKLEDTLGGTAEQNLAATCQILREGSHPASSIVCLNAAAALMVAQQPDSIHQPSAWNQMISKCQAALENGRTAKFLESLKAG